jgi:hypothetical protein
MKRGNSSRSKELNFIGELLGIQREFLNVIKRNPHGARIKINGVYVEYGNIQNIAESIQLHEMQLKLDLKPIAIYHLDNIAPRRKKEIEKQHSLRRDSLKTKADILVIAEHGNYFISFKDDKKPAKLGQVSSLLYVNDIFLKGGHLITPELPKHEFSYLDTNLTRDQFSRLNYGQKQWAVFKRSSPIDFDLIVRESLVKAQSILDDFCTELISNDDNLKNFLRKILVGKNGDPRETYVFLKDQLFNLDDLIDNLGDNHRDYFVADYESSNNKASKLVGRIYNGKKYYITKIEPSYDGSKSTVSQTKGIIFYLQEYAGSDGKSSYKSLFKDIAK